MSERAQPATLSPSRIQPEVPIRKFRMVRQEGERQVSRQIGHYTLAAVLFESYAMQRRATVDADGKAYAARMQQAPSGDEQGVTVLGQVAKKLAKKKGRSDAT